MEMMYEEFVGKLRLVLKETMRISEEKIYFQEKGGPYTPTDIKTIVYGLLSFCNYRYCLGTSEPDDVFLQNEDGTPSTQLKKRIYDLKCSLHGGIIPVSVPPEVTLREFPYNAAVELVNPVADTVSRKTYGRTRSFPIFNF